AKRQPGDHSRSAIFVRFYQHVGLIAAPPGRLLGHAYVGPHGGGLLRVGGCSVRPSAAATEGTCVCFSLSPPPVKSHRTWAPTEGGLLRDGRRSLADVPEYSSPPG